MQQTSPRDEPVGPVILKTARLTLRPLQVADAEPIATGLNDWEVTKWLLPVPWPHSIEQAEWFLNNPPSEGALAIDLNGQFVGVVHLGSDGELGYWLDRRHHGKGCMSEAVSALLAEHFRNGGGTITGGYILGNAASRKVQLKVGFRETHVEVKPSVPQGTDVDVMQMELTPEDWGRAYPLIIETARLRLAPLDPERDWAALSRIGGNPAVARNLMSVRSPWEEAQVRDWIARSLWRGRPPFRLGIWRKDGPLIGALGLGGEPLGIAYFLGQEHWGQGYATEAMTAFLAEADARFGADVLEADHFADNPASGRVLRKLGFEQTGEGLGRSAARLLPAPVVNFRRTRPT